MLKHKSWLFSIAFACALSACGGGSSSPSAPVAQTPVATTVTGQITPTVTGVPPSNAGAVTLSGANINIASSNGKYLLSPGAGANINLAGDSNIVQLSAAANLGNVTISGNDNNIIVGATVTASNLMVSGARNTIWIPTGATIKVDNAMLLTNTVKYYNP